MPLIHGDGGSSVAQPNGRAAKSSGDGSGASAPCGCIELTALRHEVAELRKVLGLAGKASHTHALRRTFGLSPVQARIACALYDAAGKVVPAYTLSEVSMSDSALLDGSDALKTHVCNLRQKIGQDAIETAPGGYAITHEGRSLLASALAISEAA